jgi:hypothetical protein
MMMTIRLHWLCDLKPPFFLIYLLKLQEYSLSMKKSTVRAHSRTSPHKAKKKKAAQAAENSGMEFRPINVCETCEVIELLDDDDEDVLNNFIRDDVAIKIEQQNNEDLRKVVEDEDEDEDEENEPISDEPRKLSRDRVPNRKFEDYELYVTVAEEDGFLLATNGEEFEEKEMESAYMVYYAEKELIKKRKKK